jgi:hypothetical protein
MICHGKNSFSVSTCVTCCFANQLMFTGERFRGIRAQARGLADDSCQSKLLITRSSSDRASRSHLSFLTCDNSSTKWHSMAVKSSRRFPDARGSSLNQRKSVRKSDSTRVRRTQCLAAVSFCWLRSMKLLLRSLSQERLTQERPQSWKDKNPCLRVRASTRSFRALRSTFVLN